MTPCPAARFACLLSITLVLAACGGAAGPEATADGDTSAADPTTVTPAGPTRPDPGTADPQTPPPDVRVFSARAAPWKLSAWGVLAVDGQTFTLGARVRPYALNTPLFSDYAHKFRTLWIPEGTRIDYLASGPLAFPVGAVVTKTFFYPRADAITAGHLGAAKVLQVEGGETIDLAAHRLIETRLMVREADGRWGAVTYVWDADQRDATLQRSGVTIDIELVDDAGARTPFTYAVPTDAQCVQCHATDATTMRFEPIGPKAANMNRDYAYVGGMANQLDHLAALGWLAGYGGGAPALAVWNDAAAPLAARARAYLEVNCASCHNPVGRSGGTGLWLGSDVADPLSLGICKAPVGGQRSGRFAYDIWPGRPDASFLYYRITNERLNAEPPRVAMPELGRHVFDAEGNALIRDWISSMTGCAD